MKLSFSISSVVLASLVLAAPAMADWTYAGAVTFVNPNGCRAFERVVDPECPSEAVLVRCEAAHQLLDQLSAQVPGISLEAECDVLHTGGGFERFVGELFNNSQSSDGYTLEASVTNPFGENREGTPDAIKAQVVAEDAVACADAVDVLAKLPKAAPGLQVIAICDSGELKATFQF